MSSISISDMQNFAENMDGGSNIQISSNIGNVIELGGDDLGDNFGADLLTNIRVPPRPAGSIQPVSTMERMDDNGFGALEPMESISFDLPSNGSADVFVNKEPSSFSNGFSNDQSASGPSINLAASTRLSADEEKKKKMELIN